MSYTKPRIFCVIALYCSATAAQYMKIRQKIPGCKYKHMHWLCANLLHEQECHSVCIDHVMRAYVCVFHPLFITDNMGLNEAAILFIHRHSYTVNMLYCRCFVHYYSCLFCGEKRVLKWFIEFHALGCRRWEFCAFI